MNEDPELMPSPRVTTEGEEEKEEKMEPGLPAPLANYPWIMSYSSDIRCDWYRGPGARQLAHPVVFLLWALRCWNGVVTTWWKVQCRPVEKEHCSSEQLHKPAASALRCLQRCCSRPQPAVLWPPSPFRGPWLVTSDPLVLPETLHCNLLFLIPELVLHFIASICLNAGV